MNHLPSVFLLRWSAAGIALPYEGYLGHEIHRNCAVPMKCMCARYFTPEGTTNSSSSVSTGVASLRARHAVVLFPHFTGLSNRRYPSSQGRGVDLFYKCFHPKGAWWGPAPASDREPPQQQLCQLLTDSSLPPLASRSCAQAGQEGRLTLDLYQESRNHHRDVDSPGSGAGNQGFRLLRAWHILVLVGFWVLPVAVWSLPRPIQLIVVATANGGKQSSPDHPRTEDKHNTVGTSLERVTDSLEGQKENESVLVLQAPPPREEQTSCQTSSSTAQLPATSTLMRKK